MPCECSWSLLPTGSSRMRRCAGMRPPPPAAIALLCSPRPSPSHADFPPFKSADLSPRPVPPRAAEGGPGEKAKTHGGRFLLRAKGLGSSLNQTQAPHPSSSSHPLSLPTLPQASSCWEKGRGVLVNEFPSLSSPFPHTISAFLPFACVQGPQDPLREGAGGLGAPPENPNHTGAAGA